MVTSKVITAPIVGSVKEIDLKRSVKEKLDTMVIDESGLKRPLTITIAIPTKIDVGRKSRRKEIETLGKMLRECSQLADLGYVDEIIVLDGSVNKLGKPDYSVLTKVIKTAYLYLSLFRREVGLIASSKAEAMHASRGFFDFFVKAVHQYDPNIAKLITSKVPQLKNVSHMPPGKGTALWMFIPLTKGDILCFLDSDIMNFEKEMVVALCHPLVNSIRNKRLNYRMTKAFYKRLTLRYESEHKDYVFGGRVTRLFALPLIKVLSIRYPTIFGGLETLRYPLSGESAIIREVLEEIEFPYDYSVEVAILYQIAQKHGLKYICQSDLDLFYHIGQSVKGLQNMVQQITTYFINILNEKNIQLNKEEVYELVQMYIEEANSLFKEHRRVFNTLKKDVKRRVKEPIFYSKQTDIQRLKLFSSIITETLQNPIQPKDHLPPWSSCVSDLDYLVLSTLMKRRANQSTYSRLRSAELIPKI